MERLVPPQPKKDMKPKGREVYALSGFVSGSVTEIGKGSISTYKGSWSKEEIAFSPCPDPC